MSTSVSVSDVVEALELATEETSSYIHKTTGQVVTIAREEMQLAEDTEDIPSNLPDWQKRALALALDVQASEQWLPLPSRFAVDEWRLMDDFVRTLVDPRVRDELADAIRGRGAFRRFKGAVRRLGLEDAWYTSRATALDRIAREWLSEHGFEVDGSPR